MCTLIDNANDMNEEDDEIDDNIDDDDLMDDIFKRRDQYKQDILRIDFKSKVSQFLTPLEKKRKEKKKKKEENKRML